MENNFKTGTLEYEKATLKLIAARNKFDDEFGNKKTVKIVADAVIPKSEDDKKAAKKAESEYERLKKEAAKFQEELL